MAWNVWVVNTVNGARRQKLPPKSFTWERVMNAAGTGRMVIQLRDRVVSQLPYMDLTKTLSRTVVLSWDDKVVYAGIIWSREYDRDAGTMTLTLGDLWTMLAVRLAIDRGATNIAASKLAWSGLSLPTLCKKVIQAGFTLPSNDWVLPIVYPADVPGTYNHELAGYDFPVVGDIVDEIIFRDGGPDTDFQGSWTVGSDPTFRWVMRSDFLLNEGMWEWNLAAQKSGVTGLTWLEDAHDVTTSLIGRGEGSEKNVLHKRVQADGLGYAIERVKTSPNQKTEAEVGWFAMAQVGLLQKPTEQWDFSVVTDQRVQPSSLLLGGTVRLMSSGDPVIPDGQHDHRLIQFSGSLNQKVKLGVQPMGGA